MATTEIPIATVGAKLVGAALTYSVEFANLTAPLAAHTVTTETAGATVEASDTSGLLVRARIAGGPAGDVIKALFQATDAGGQDDACWVIIPVIAAP